MRYFFYLKNKKLKAKVFLNFYFKINMQNTSGTQYGSLEARHSTNPNYLWMEVATFNQQKSRFFACIRTMKRICGYTLWSDEAFTWSDVVLKGVIRSCPATVARRNATHTSGAVGHVDSLCVLLNVSNTASVTPCPLGTLIWFALRTCA